MTRHARFSPSSAHRWINCPGSLQFIDQCRKEKRIPKKEGPSSYALLGSAAHWVASEALVAGDDAANYVGAISHGVTIDDEIAENVQVYVDTVREAGRVCEDTPDIEQRVKAPSLGPDCFGTVDCAIYNKETRHLSIFDYKNGLGAVDAEKNYQLLYYTLGAVETFYPQANRFTTTIVQPRILNRDPIQPWSFGRSELLNFKLKAQAAIKEATGPSPSLNAGDHCKFCPVAGVCPEQQKHLAVEVKMDFTGLETDLPLKKPEALSDEELGRAYLIEKQVKAWFDSVRKAIHYRVGQGARIPNVKMVAGRGRRLWKDEKEVVKELGSCYGDDIYEPQKLRSPAQMEKLEKKGAFDHLIERKAGAPTIVSADDRRKEIGAMDFSELETE